jgi:hypothetical protein
METHTIDLSEQSVSNDCGQRRSQSDVHSDVMSFETFMQQLHALNSSLETLAAIGAELRRDGLAGDARVRSVLQEVVHGIDPTVLDGIRGAVQRQRARQFALAAFATFRPVRSSFLTSGCRTGGDRRGANPLQSFRTRAFPSDWRVGKSSRGYSGIFGERGRKPALLLAQRPPTSGLQNQPRSDSAFSVEWVLKIFSHSKPHMGSSNDTILPEALMWYKEQRRPLERGLNQSVNLILAASGRSTTTGELTPEETLSSFHNSRDATLARLAIAGASAKRTPCSTFSKMSTLSKAS